MIDRQRGASYLRRVGTAENPRQSSRPRRQKLCVGGIMKKQIRSTLVAASGAQAFLVCALTSFAIAQPLTVGEADPGKPGYSRQTGARRPLPASKAEALRKAALDRDVRKQSAALTTDTRLASPLVASASTLVAPTLATTFSFEGQAAALTSPPVANGAIGRTRYIQVVNRSVGIYSRTSGALLASGTLDDLAGLSTTVESFDPQIMWDPSTNRFYYLMNSNFSASDNRLSFGFSKTATPTNTSTDWCHYDVAYGAEFPNFPKLGDSRYFLIFGVNTFSSSDETGGFVGSDLIAVSKPAAGSVCPAASSFKMGSKRNLADAFTPVPANQIDRINIGYAVARKLTLSGTGSSSMLWIFDISRNSTTGFPVFSDGKAVTVAAHSLPANAAQPTVTQLLDTLDTRPTHAVQAFDPRLGVFSLWTQQTIANGPSGSSVRWYQIDPAPTAPVVLRWGNLSAGANTFVFNAATSPDRKVDGLTTAFGNNAVMEYNISSKTVAPRINAASSVDGAAFTTVGVRAGVGPYVDFTCPDPADVCRWGDQSSASPDPKPVAGATGQVWGTNQYSGVVNPSPANGNFRTRIFRLNP